MMLRNHPEDGLTDVTVDDAQPCLHVGERMRVCWSVTLQYARHITLASFTLIHYILAGIRNSSCVTMATSRFYCYCASRISIFHLDMNVIFKAQATKEWRRSSICRMIQILGSWPVCSLKHIANKTQKTL